MSVNGGDDINVVTSSERSATVKGVGEKSELEKKMSVASIASQDFSVSIEFKTFTLNHILYMIVFGSFVGRTRLLSVDG